MILHQKFWCATVFGGFVDVTSLDNTVKEKSTADVEIVNVAKTKTFYYFC